MTKKNLSIIFVIFMFIFCLIFFVPHNRYFRIQEVLSPTEFIFDNGQYFKIDGIETFDSRFTARNKEIAKNLNITELDAFVLGNLAHQKASSLMKGRRILIKNNSDIIYYQYSYKEKFLYTGYCLKNNNPFIKEIYEKRLKESQKAQYKILDLDNYKLHDLTDPQIRKLNNFLLIRKSHLPEEVIKPKSANIAKLLDLGNIKLLLTDSTSKLFPDRNCNTSICKEIIKNINESKKTIDIAIYGYSSVPAIEKALISAQNRGVKVRLVYDVNNKGNNIYPDTNKILEIISNNQNDINSNESRNIMHNKFYIFDNKILITGSANLSHTDMSEFNSNSIIIINSPKIANIYTQEFEQMFNGKFHNDKNIIEKSPVNVSNINMKVYFSPQDKTLQNAVIPLIKNANKYIYIPTFVLTSKEVSDELIRAKQRGVEVKVIMDALNASIKHSKHNELRLGSIPVKTENYAGKMHSKSMIIDDKYTIIGSMNFSDSGENKNDENLIVIQNDTITKFYKDFFLYQWNKIDDKWLKNNVRAEGKDSIGSCFDKIDNNYDGLTDADDPACKDM
ncbi:MAG: DUF1669 domain-containing protein [Cyanobacteria bacterium SIG31]|nr:DUF1669 domain-containing protein [Cyanobacteria bacterium SIG31]